MKKKFILAVLAAALLTQSASMLCVSADEIAVSDDPVIVEVAEEEVAVEEIVEEAVEEEAELSADDEYKGTDGSISWVYNNGKLLLLGADKMNEHEEGTAPWYKVKDSVTEIVIQEGITSIGRHAFDDFTQLRSVTIPSSLLAIGDYAFADCSNLLSIDFPAKLNSIGISAFANCSSLTNVVVPNTVQIINENAFEGCTSLSSLSVPFTGYYRYSFDNTNTFDFIFNGNVPSSLKTVAITDDTGLPVDAFNGCKYIENITVNPEVQVIGERAFMDCASLKAFAIPAGVPEIKDETFSGCNSIRSITVPDSVQAIGTSAFYNCYDLQEIYVPYGVSKINDTTFYNCRTLTRIELPDSVVSVGKETMKGCNSLRSLKVPFVGSNPSAGITVAWSEDSVFGWLFGYSTSDTSQTEQYQAGSNRLYYYVPASLENVQITNPNRLSAVIPQKAFVNCRNIKSITVDSGIKVNDNAFRNCTSLRSLFLPSTVSYIGADILYGCQAVENITVPFIGENYTNNNSEKSVLGYFWGYSDTMAGLDIQQQYAEGMTKYYHIPTTLKEVTVSRAVDLPYGAFYNCYYLEKVILGTSGKIDNYAFYNCQSVKDIVLPSDLEEIGYEAFANCTELENINVPSGASEIGKRAFYNATKLKTILLPDSMTEIDPSAFIAGPTMMSYEGDEEALLAASSNLDTTLRVIKGSKAEEFAKANGFDYEYADLAEFETLTTTSTYHSGTFSVNDTSENKKAGVVYAAAYDKNGKLLDSAMTEADGKGSYSVTLDPAKVENATKAKIFFWNDKENMTPVLAYAEDATEAFLAGK